MEFVDDLKKEEYEKFLLNAKCAHFMQSYDFGQIRKEKHFVPHYVGLKENGKLKCTCLLLEKKLIGKYCYYYVPRGYTIDYSNTELLKEFTKQLRIYAKKNHAIFIKIDPDIKRYNLDIDGNIIDGDNNSKLISDLKNMGYKHLGFNKGFENEQPRFTFRLNLDNNFEKIYSNFHATTRKILNKGNKYNLDLYKGTVDDIDDFYLTMKETAKREGILQAPIEYYKTFYEIFNKDNYSDLYIVKANIKKIKETISNNIDEVKKDIERINNNTDKVKGANKVHDLQKQLEKLKIEYNNIDAIKEDNIVLSSIITVKYKDRVWTVHGGNNSCLMELNANYLLYYTIIKDAYDEGYKKIDFFGASGYANPDKNNPIFGIHSFKKRFGGEYTEFIGEFDLIINKPIYYIFKTLIPIYRKIKRKLVK